MWKKDEKVDIVFTNKSKSWWDILELLRLLESKIRYFLIVFCSFAFLYSLTDMVLSKYIPMLETLNIYTLGIMVILSFFIGYFIRYELMEFFSQDWDWKPRNKVEKFQNEFFCLAGIGILYYFTQVGAMVIFFPSFETIMVHTFKLYSVLFAATSILIYVLYRMTIIKFE